MNKHLKLTFIIFLLPTLLLADIEESYWDTFLAGKIQEIPHKPVREYLLDTHHRNPYADQNLKVELAKMGVFSPIEDNIFWLPHIEVPATDKYWRFLSSDHEIPVHLKKMIFFKKSGKDFVRMFIHPFSTERKYFIELAEKFGGIKYEFQAVTTASVRSFMAWKTNQTYDQIGNQISFPSNTKNIFKVKVSVYGTDIDGSRLNPDKKMVRAYGVSHLFANMSEKSKEELNFDFENEWFTAVPDRSNAGYVVREALPELTDKSRNITVEPGHATLTPNNLSKLVGRRTSGAIDQITEELFSPVAKVAMHLLFEEGMMGEYHTQNFDYVAKNGIPTGKILMHDADAFRVNLTYRAIKGKDVLTPSMIENPFFYLKETTYGTTQNVDWENITLNSLLDYLMDPDDDTSMVTTIHDWCKNKPSYKSFCTKKKIKANFLENLAQHVSTHLGREVDPSELDYDTTTMGKKGLIALFDENFRNELAKVSPDENLPLPYQKEVKKEFDRLLKLGNAQFQGAKVTEMKLESFEYKFIIDGNNQYIRVLKKKVREGDKSLKAIAIMGKPDDPKTMKFLQKMAEMDPDVTNKRSCLKSMQYLRNILRTKIKSPVMRAMGGGNNI